MSQFRVQKVTKVKGPSELPAGKTNESKKVRANPSNTAERPQAQPRLKKTSYSKSAELKSSTSSSDKPSTSTSSGQRSSTRNRPTAAKRSTPKTCPSQQSKRNGSPQTASKQTRNKPGVDSTKTHSVPPKPSVPQRPPHKETPVKKSTQIEKENSYDASGSDSDEPHLSGKLSPKDDIGYETGSFDEIDGSNSESTSPAAGEENKTILSQSREEESTASYSYAEVEFRPLIVSDEGGVSAPVHTRHQDQLQSPENVDNTNDRLSYAYVSDEFRPLVITDNGGIAAPQETKKSEQINNLPVVDQRRAPMRYEEVEVLSGKFDRANVNTSQLRAGIPGSSNIAVENEDDTYEAVDQQNITSQLQHRTEQITNTRQQDFTLNNVDQDVGDVYAVVQKDKTKKESKENPKLAALSYKVQESETPPELPSRMDITKSDLCESISGELQDMISAYDEVNTNGKCSRSSSREGYVSSDNSKVAARPPLPKPYSGSGMTVENTGLESTSSDEDFNGSPLYAAVQKKPKNKTQKKKDPQITKQPEEIPPPLPSRTVLEKDDTLGREVDLSQLEKESQEKSKKSGFGIFKKKHQRKMSDGNVISNAEKLGYLSPGASKKGHKRSKSQDDIAKVMNNLLGDSVGKTRGDSGDVIEPYLAVDITDPPNTPRELQGLKSYWEDKEDQYLDNDLPEGWKEVESENGTKYYWHVSSGTTQWERPQVLQRPKKTSGEQIQPSQVVERQKVLSFPVHSMGWIELEENQVAPHNMSDTIGDCISTLARNRKDLWQTSETWGEGKDIRLLLEGDTLKLVEPRNKITLLVQPVSKMRVWGVGKEDHRDFAYVARDPNTGKHKCHMFRCHGNISGRAITTALHEMCNKILEEKKRAQEISKKISQTKPWSDIINTPAPLSAKDSAGFNEKPFREQKKDFTATYLGCTDVPKPTGMEMLNKAINKVASRGGAKRTVLIHVTVSCIRITDCTSQEEISEDRVRFLSFMGVGKDERLCGYVMVNEPDQFVCHVFQCTPNAAPLTKALEEACQLRYQKCLDAHPEMASKVIASQEQESDKSKDKANFMSSVQGLLGKLGTKKSGIKKEDVVTGPPLPKPSHTFMVKYYGALPVAVGTGIETVEEAAKHLTGGTLLICQLDVAINGVTLYDSQRSALSRRHMDADTISFCGLTSDNGHFGLIQCQGGGKYVCHVFSEYKTKAAPIVAAIHETL